jgi:hypothetical protein
MGPRIAPVDPALAEGLADSHVAELAMPSP